MSLAKEIMALLVSLATLTGLIVHCWRDKRRFSEIARSKEDER